MKNGHALVSVIVPIYNVERYLARCLDSILSQTYGNLEVICVNDGSSDGSAAILEDFAAKDSRIKVFSQTNKGQSVARNVGLDAMSGDYVIFVDSDDWIPRYAVERFLKVAESSGALVVVSKDYMIDKGNGGSVKPCDCEGWSLQSPALAKLVGQRKLQSSACNKFYAASILKTRRFIEGIYFEDWPFVTEIFGDLDSFALAEASLYVYCKNGESTVRSAFTEKKVVSYLTGISHVAEHFVDHPMRKYAMRRMATAAKMLVNKTLESGDKSLRAKALENVKVLFSRGVLDRRFIDLKTRFRLWLGSR